MPVVLSSKSKKRNRRLEASEERITTSLKRFKITAEAESESRRQGLEDFIHVKNNMQPNGCLSRGCFGGRVWLC